VVKSKKYRDTTQSNKRKAVGEIRLNISSSAWGNSYVIEIMGIQHKHLKVTPKGGKA